MYSENKRSLKRSRAYFAVNALVLLTISINWSHPGPVASSHSIQSLNRVIILSTHPGLHAISNIKHHGRSHLDKTNVSTTSEVEAAKMYFRSREPVICNDHYIRVCITSQLSSFDQIRVIYPSFDNFYLSECKGYHERNQHNVEPHSLEHQFLLINLNTER